MKPLIQAEIKNGVATVMSDNPILEVTNLFGPRIAGNNEAQSFFTSLIENDEGFNMLMNTAMSRQLRALRDGATNGNAINIAEKVDGKFYLKNIPKMSFSPMTSDPDECCVVPGELQLCADKTELKMLCIEKCKTELEGLVDEMTGIQRNSIAYVAYQQMMINSGYPKADLPTIEQFEQLSLIAQFIALNMLTFLNGVLDVEQNGNIIKRFNGLAQVYAEPDIYTIDGSVGILEAFKEANARVRALGKSNFIGGFYLADRVAYAAVVEEVQEKPNGKYPSGWNVVTETKVRDGISYQDNSYYYDGFKIVESELLYIDTDTMDGNIQFIPQTVGLISGIPLDMPGSFIKQEYDKPKSTFVHWDKENVAFPDCWTDCNRIVNAGAVVRTESNQLIAITNIKSSYMPKVLSGIEGMININSYAPYIK